ncbi:MAG: ABC transporter ATP-binding protein [Planctomycetales bacterium]|nr:ABC transporter ATP-binding protein [Planctomycetales bacterium]
MGKPRHKNLAFWILIRQQLRASKWSVLLAVLATIGLAMTEVLRPWPLKIIFDYVLLEKPVPEWLSFAKGVLEHQKTEAVVGISACLVLVAILKGTFAFAESYQMSRFGNQVAFLLRTRLFNHLQRLSLRFHSQSRMGEMLTKISGDTSTVKSFLSDSALSMASHGLIILASFSVMFLVHVKMTLLVLATFPVLVVTIGLLHRQARTAQRSQRKKQEAISSRISEVLGAVHLVQAFGREQHEQKRFDKDNDKYLSVALKNARIESAAARAVEVTSALGTAAVVAYGSLLVLKNEMTPGSILVFSSYLHGMYRPIRRMVKQIVRLSQLQVSIERISEILSVDQDIVERPNAVSAAGVQGRIEFQQVAFSYNDDGNVLDQISFCIEPGERIAVIGASGAGKSTIMGLMLRLYDPSSGAVLLDGRDLRDYKLDSLRSQFSTVLQDSLLMGSTIHDNIAYGKLDASREDVIRAAQMTHADEFIQRLPDGYDTVVGSKGSTLSGGQQRRLAIARAIIRNSPILIMDEPMTGLDTASESAVNQQLQAFLQDRTSIVITHDLNAAQDADRVLVLQHGRIIRWGKPAEIFQVGQEVGFVEC